VPTLIVWGSRDGVIPVAHASIAHDLIPGSRLEIIPGAGHFVPLERPDVFLAVLNDFLATTQPAAVSTARWQQVLGRGSAPEN